MATNTSTLTIQGNDFEIYGSFQTDITGPPLTLSAINYFTGSLGATGWSAASFSDRQLALVSATRLLEKQRWLGTPTDTVTPQPLLWPRTGIVDCDGQPVDPTCVPEGIVHGMYELANILLAQDADTSSSASVANDPNAGSNLKRTTDRDKVAELEQVRTREYFRPTGGFGSNASPRFPLTVDELIRCFLGGSAIGVDALSFASGVDIPSHFADRDFGFVPDGLP